MGNNMPNAQFNEFGQPANNAPQQKLEVYAQSLAQHTRTALNNTASPQAMTQGSPMNQGLDGQEIMFAPNQPRPGMPPQQPGQPQQGSHALQDYQMQLMLLEQQNKKRLLMARQEQDNISGPHQQGQGQFPPAMSPSGTRAGPSPNPADMKGRTPKLGQQGLPGSPMPEGVMQQRASPAPNMNFPDPNLAPPGMPPQFYPQMPNNPMMRPPSSHPGANFNGQQMTPQQMEAMRNGQMNGQWRGGPPQPGMPQQPQMMGGPMVGGPQQRNQMPPPPAPTNEQRPEASPAMSNQAPPTPNQGNKAGPKKKGTKDNKVKLCASQYLSDIDIDIRSPRQRRGRTQVQRRQPPQAKKPPRRHRLRPSHRCTPSRLTRTASHSRPHSSLRKRKPLASSLWATMLRSAISPKAVSTLASTSATAMLRSRILTSTPSCTPARTLAASVA
jgi:hypothetical protein